MAGGSISASYPFSTKGQQTSDAGWANIAGFKAHHADKADHWKGGGAPHKWSLSSGDMKSRLESSPFRK